MEISFQNRAEVLKEKSNIFLTVVFGLAYYSIALLLTFSGLAKLYNPYLLLDTLRFAIPLPAIIIVGMVSFISILETVMGLMLVLRIKPDTNLKIVSVLFGFIFIYAIFGNVAGIEGEAGCFGGIISSHFDVAMVIKVALYFLVSVLLLIKEIELP